MPDWKAEIWRRLDNRTLASRPDVVEEIAQHLDQRYRGLIAAGRPEDAASLEALQELAESGAFAAELQQTFRAAAPDPVLLGESHRRRLLASVRHDLRYGVRILVKSPGFTAVALAALALGVGANTAIFSVVNAVMLRPLPFPEPDRLVRIWESNPGGGWATFSASHPNFLDWRTRNTTFERLAAAAGVSFSATSDDGAQIVRGNAVTVDFLPALGLSPAVGRNFRAEEDRPGANARVAIISHGLWQRTLGGDPQILQRTLTLDGNAYTVIGVLPASFPWAQRIGDVLVPLAPDPARGRGDHRLEVIGRLHQGRTIEQARADLTAIAFQLAAQFPASNRGWTVRLLSFRDWLVPEETRESLLIFAGAVVLVLLIACGNVASLLLARGTERQQEIAIRAALGAERSRIVRQLLVEALLLSIVAGAIGIAIAHGTCQLLLAYAPDALPRLDELSVDGGVLVFALLASVTTGLLFGTVPALQASRPHLTATLREGTAGAGGGRRRQHVRNAVVVVEVALSVALLIGAGLLIRSYWRLQRVDPGFDSGNLLTLRVNLLGQQYGTREMKWAFYDRLLTELRALPGVQAAATSSIIPMGGGNTSTEVRLVGKAPDQNRAPGADWRNVSPGYFHAMGIRVRGREFADADTPTSQRVLIISETAARLYFPNEDPIGKTIVLISFGPDPLTIIGVAGDVRHAAIDTDPGPMVYGSAKVYAGWNPMFVAIRTSGDPTARTAAARAIVRSIDPKVPIDDVRTADELVAQSLGSRQFNMYLLACFAAIALILACVGLFGVMTYIVSHRTRDIGIRLALGAAPASVLRLILGQGLALTMTGVVLGLACGFAVTGTMRSLLYSVQPTDTITFVSVPLVLVAVALLACYVPARRAMRVDPLTALRS